MPRPLLIVCVLAVALGLGAPGPALAAEPVNLTLPSVTGTLVVGETLTGTRGTWDAEATSFSYDWQRCDAVGLSCANIPGASGTFSGPTTTYVPTPADFGVKLRLRVYGHGAGGTGLAVSEATSGPIDRPPAHVPVNTTRPSISLLVPGPWLDTAPVGGNGGAWDDDYRDYFYGYTWLRCNAAGAACAEVAQSVPFWGPGQRDMHYSLTAADVGSTLRLQVSALNEAGVGVSVSEPSPVIAARPVPPVNVGPPFLLAGFNQGDPNATFSAPADAVTPRAVGDVLTLYQGAWLNAEGTTVQWLRCEGENCVVVPGAGNTYVVTKDDTGKTIRAQVTVSNAAGAVTVLTGPVPGPKPPSPAAGNPNVFGNPGGAPRKVPNDVIEPRQRSLKTGRIRGRVEVKDTGSTVEIVAYSVRAFDRRVRSLRVGSSTQDEVRAGRVAFGIRLTPRYRRALGRRASVVLRIKVTPPTGAAITRSRTITVTR